MCKAADRGMSIHDVRAAKARGQVGEVMLGGLMHDALCQAQTATMTTYPERAMSLLRTTAVFDAKPATLPGRPSKAQARVPRR